MFKGWRVQLHYHSRNKEGLKKWALSVVIGTFVACWVIVQMMPRVPVAEGIDPVEQDLRNGWQRLYHATEAQPRQLARWLRHLMPRARHLCDVAGMEHPTQANYQAGGKIAGFEIQALVRRHAPDTATAAVVGDFLEASLAEQFPGPAFERIRGLAEGGMPPPLANELHAALLMRAQQPEAALPALMREARLFADATTTREDALRLALKLKEHDTLREIAHETDWLRGMSGWLVYKTGEHLLDPWLMGAGLLALRRENLPLLPLLLTVIASGLWYAILVLQSAPRRGRWWYPLLPMAAGVVSIWPALWLGAWQELRLGMTENAPFPNDLWYWVMGVGLREEAAKLALFALFLPWLLRRRDAGLALITGAFVGLGFALEENIDYYQRTDGAVSIGRFLTANFAHLAQTGIAGHALYDLWRSRFHHADRFAGMFFAVVAIHGLYDFAASGTFEGSGFFTIALLAFVAWYFLDLLAHEAPAARQIVAPAGLFVMGTALLMALSFAVSAFQQGTPEALAGTAAECLGLIPVGFIYWRRLL